MARRSDATVYELPVPFPAPFQPSQCPLQRVAGSRLVRAAWHHMIERHRNVGAERPLDLRGALRREGAAAAVYVTLKLHAVVVDTAEPLEREHLEPTRIGEQRTIPTHEAMQGSQLLNHLLAGPHMQVVGIREHQRRAGGAEVIRGKSPHAPLRPDRHEYRGFHRAVGEGKRAGAGRTPSPTVSNSNLDLFGNPGLAPGVSGGTWE